jgi:hypothetical protein
MSPKQPAGITHRHDMTMKIGAWNPNSPAPPRLINLPTDHVRFRHCWQRNGTTTSSLEGTADLDPCRNVAGMLKTRPGIVIRYSGKAATLSGMTFPLTESACHG